MTLKTSLATALSAVSRTMNSATGVDETLQAIADSARWSVPGFDHVGISTVDSRGRIHTRATTDAIVDLLDDVQYTIGEGPCVTAVRESAVVEVPNIRQEQRWRRYVTAAVEAGLRSQLAVRLYLEGDGTLGVLNMYSVERDDVDEDARPTAELFATHAALALGHATTVGHLNSALISRTVIGSAVGIVMERYQLDQARAFAFLVRMSSHGNIKLRDVAEDIVAQVNERHQVHPTPRDTANEPVVSSTQPTPGVPPTQRRGGRRTS